MALQVIDGDQGNIERQGQRLRRGQADHEGTDQARPGGHGDHPQVGERDPRPPQGLVDHRQDLLTWALEAISGTTPPKRWCRPDLRGHHAGEHPRHPVAGGRGPSSTAAPVSSQVVSMARKTRRDGSMQRLRRSVSQAALAFCSSPSLAFDHLQGLVQHLVHERAGLVMGRPDLELAAWPCRRSSPSPPPWPSLLVLVLVFVLVGFRLGLGGLGWPLAADFRSRSRRPTNHLTYSLGVSLTSMPGLGDTPHLSVVLESRKRWMLSPLGR